MTGTALRRTVVPTALGPVVVRTSPWSAGTAVLLVHGAAGSWTTWQPLLATAVAEGRPLEGVVAVDLPGWGESPAPLGPMGADAAADVLVEVLRALGAVRWSIVGHSLGGFVALALAARHPAETSGVVLVSPTGPAVLEAIRRPVRGGLRLPWFAGMLLAMRAMGAMPGDGSGVLRLLGRLHALGPLAAPLFTARVGPEVAARFATEIRPAAFLRAARAAGAADFGEWPRIACPVRSLRGERDVFAGLADAAALAALIPDFAEEVLPDAGHFATAERPDAVLAALRSLP